MTEAKASASFDHKKLFGFRVMIVTAARYTRMSSKVLELAVILCFELLYKNAAGVAIFRDVIGKAFRWQIT